jgi:hypothetical protein
MGFLLKLLKQVLIQKSVLNNMKNIFQTRGYNLFLIKHINDNKGKKNYYVTMSL